MFWEPPPPPPSCVARSSGPRRTPGSPSRSPWPRTAWTTCAFASAWRLGLVGTTRVEESRSRLGTFSVEDDDNVREALRRILELDGHRVEVARDGPGGVELALATVPEIALVDIGLPGIDGYEVGRRIRAALGNRVLLVAVTAYGQEQDRRRTSEAGFDAHLVKPISYQDLTRLLGHVGPSDA
jgi:CheY-like chemotaxis protein